MTGETNNKKNRLSGFLENLTIWFAVFVVSIAVLAMFNLAPPEVKEVGKYFFNSVFSNKNGTAPLGSLNSNILSATASVGAAETQGGNETAEADSALIYPIRIVIKKIGVDSPIANPADSDPKVLDNYLLGGVVRYPGSGTLEDNLNIFLFGHSSYLSIVNNKAFKSFNRLQELQLGDEVELFSDSRAYFYKVTKVELADASEALVNFSSGKKKVILSTCDSFGSKSDRFVVEATFSGSRSLN